MKIPVKHLVPSSIDNTRSLNALTTRDKFGILYALTALYETKIEIYLY